MPVFLYGLLKALMLFSIFLKGSGISAVATDESIVPRHFTSLSKYFVSLDCELFNNGSMSWLV